MKIQPDQLGQYLQSHHCFWLSGDEALLLQEAADQIRSDARSQGFTERDLYHVENGFDWQEVLQSACELSLFSSQKFIELRLVVKLNDAGRKALATLAAQASPETRVLISGPRIDASSSKAKWFRQIEEHCVWIPFWPLSRQQFPGWLRQRFRACQLEIDNEALTILAERTDGNLLAASQEVEKLRLLSDGSTITPELVARSVSDSSRYDVFDLTDAALNGDLSRSVKILNGLRGEGIEPPVVLWALSRELRTLSNVMIQLNSGQARANVFRQNGIWKNRENAIQKAMTRLSVHETDQLLLQAGRIDQVIKGLKKSDPWMELQALLLGFCSGQRHFRILPALLEND